MFVTELNSVGFCLFDLINAGMQLPAWEADDALWSSADDQRSKSNIGDEMGDPWATPGDNVGAETVTPSLELSADDFSSLSPAECNSLCNLESPNSIISSSKLASADMTSNQLKGHQSSAFETDYNYLSKLGE